MKLPVLLTLTLLLPATAGAQQAHQEHKSAYAGEETRSIKSLSEDDISELRRGGGWGLAKAAELNGMPGPSHVLEMAEKLNLGPDQERRVRAVFEAMQREAAAEGARYVFLEEGLETRFRDRTVSDATLEGLLASIEQSRARLRYIHLSAHLSLLDVLTETQIENYNKARGYKTPG